MSFNCTLSVPDPDLQIGGGEGVQTLKWGGGGGLQKKVLPICPQFGLKIKRSAVPPPPPAPPLDLALAVNCPVGRKLMFIYFIILHVRRQRTN